MSEDSSNTTPSEIDSRLEAAKARVVKRRLYVVDSPAGELILGAPRAVDYSAYRALLFSEDPADKAKAPNTLLLACAVDPGPAEMKALLDDYVGLAGCAPVAQGVSYCVGTAKADQAKK